jgi:hypothetical protein
MDKPWAQFKIDFTSAHGESHLTNQTAQQHTSPDFTVLTQLLSMDVKEQFKVMMMLSYNWQLPRHTIAELSPL